MVMQNRFTKVVVCLAAGALVLGTLVASAAARTTTSRVAKQSTTKATPARATTKKTYSATSASNRRAQLARARAAARARQMRDVQTPRFRVDEFGREVPDVRAEAAIIYNPQTNEVLWEDHAQDRRSIASITKVMTALVFLESGADPRHTGHGATHRRVTRLHHLSSQRLQADRRDLLNLLLVGSDNAAARALARISPYGSDGFIDQMNEKAATLGLDHDPLRGSVGTARRQTCRRRTTWRG